MPAPLPASPMHLPAASCDVGLFGAPMCWVSRVLGVARVAGFVVTTLVVGCSGSTQTTGLRAVQDKGRASSAYQSGADQGRCEWKNHTDREVSEVPGPGSLFPNIRRVYQYTGGVDDRRRVLICREVDSNLDGIKDVVRIFDEKGQSISEEADSDYDGRVDTWIKFSNGRVVEVRRDRNGDGNPDETKFYAGGSLVRARRDLNGDTKDDVWEFYTREGLERMGVDVDFDTRVDRWDHDEVRRRVIEAKEREDERAAHGDGGTTGGAQAVPSSTDTTEPVAQPAEKKGAKPDKKGAKPKK